MLRTRHLDRRCCLSIALRLTHGPLPHFHLCRLILILLGSDSLNFGSDSARWLSFLVPAAADLPR